MSLNLSQGTDDVPQQQRKPEKLTIDLQTLQHFWNKGVEWSSKTFRNRVRLDTLRPLTMFLGINNNNNNNTTSSSNASMFCYISTEAFSPPVKHLDKSTLEKVKSRLSLNLAFFLTNYVLVFVTVAAVVSLMHPSMLLFVGLLYGLWAGHNAWGNYHVVMFGLDLHRYLYRGIRERALIIITIIVVVWKCLWPVVNSIILSALIIFTHAFLRDPKHIDLADDSVPLSSTSSAGNIDDDGDAEGAAGGNYKGDMSESAVLVERPGSKGNMSNHPGQNRLSAQTGSSRGDVI